MQDPEAHLKFLKPSPEANKLVDRCIECGFCESNCPSKDLTLTPRQRITVWREINRLRDIEGRTPDQEQRSVLWPFICPKELFQSCSATFQGLLRSGHELLHMHGHEAVATDD